MTEPPRPPYRHEKEEEKRDEKEEKNRGSGESWEEKWRRDAINSASWAAIFIWAGLVLLAETTGWGYDTFYWWNTWAVILTGAGAIMLLAAIARLVMPEHRRPIVGNLIIGFIMLGIGLGQLTTLGWSLLGAIVLIAIGISIVLGGVFRKRK
jgi:hypothetical protein